MEPVPTDFGTDPPLSRNAYNTTGASVLVYSVSNDFMLIPPSFFSVLGNEL